MEEIYCPNCKILEKICLSDSRRISELYNENQELKKLNTEIIKEYQELKERIDELTNENDKLKYLFHMQWE